MKMTQGGFNILRQKLGKLNASFVQEVEYLVQKFDENAVTYPEAAYMLATVYHETAATMLPIEEIGKGRKKKYGQKRDIDGSIYTGLDHIYYGRGYVQLTWLSNYVFARKKLGVDFVNFPEKALEKDNAVRILITGMREGWFTGHKLSQHINSSKKDYFNARRIINGLDCATAIEEEAVLFEKALRAM